MNWKDKNVLVTGGAGFLGSHLVERLAGLGASVTVVDNVREATNLSHIKGIEFITCDLSDITAAKGVVGEWNYIFHLAALANPRDCEENPMLAFRVNSQATFNILNLSLKRDVEKIILTSSAQLYGRHPNYLPVDEKHPTNSSESVYNLTKNIAEDLCLYFYETYGVPVLFLRLFNTFGPRQSKDYLIPTVILQALKNNVIEIWNEKPTRDFTYVDDTVKALVKSAEVKYKGGPINIGSGKEVNVGEIARRVAEKLNCELKILNKEVTGSLRMQCDNSKSGRILGWKPEVPFEVGLGETVNWYKANSHLF